MALKSIITGSKAKKKWIKFPGDTQLNTKILMDKCKVFKQNRKKDSHSRMLRQR